MRFWILACVLAAFASPAAADAIYDVGTNTTFATFNAALSQAYADHPGPLGVTVRARALDASVGPISLDGGSLPFQPQPGFRLVLESGPGVSPLVSGSGSYGVFVSGVANVSVRGLRVQGFSVAGIRLVNASGAEVSDCTVNGAGSAAVDALNCPGMALRRSSLAPSAGTGALVSGSAMAVLSDNVVPSSAGVSYGLVVQYSDGAGLWRNRADGAGYAFNVFSSRGVTVNANVSVARGKFRGLVLDNAPQALVDLNLLVGQQVGVELQSATGCALVQNTVWEHSTAALFAHNSSQPLTVRNNLWQGFISYYVDPSSLTGLDSDHNGFRYDAQLASGGVSCSDLAAWQGTGRDAGSTQADPLFAVSSGVQPDDYRLQAGSTVLGFGTDLSSLLNQDYFEDVLSPAPAPWDPGFHVQSVTQKAPTATPTATPVLPTPTPTLTATPSITMTFTPSPVGTATTTPTVTLTPTITATYTVTPYPYKRDRLITYPNPWSPGGAALNIVFEPADRAGLRVFDMAGELVAELPDGAVQASLGHAVWDGKDRDGRAVPSGLYLCVVSTPQGTKFTRFTVLY